MNQQNPWTKQMINRNNNPSQSTNKPPVTTQSNDSPPNPWKSQMKKVDSPSWMKKNQDAQEFSNTPSWMKKKQQNSSPNNNNQWKPANKFGGGVGAKFQLPQEKRARQQRQQQQRLAKIRQQQQIRRKQQEQRKLIERLKSRQRQQQQRKLMHQQQQISKSRQNAEKEQQSSAKKNKKSKKSPKKKSKNTQFSPSVINQDNYYNNFLTLLQQSASKSDHITKIHYQKQLLKLLSTFSNEATQKVKQLVSNKKIIPRKKCYIYLEGYEIRYGLGESVVEQNKFTNKFTTEQIQKIRLKFNLYKNLQQTIFNMLKKNNTLKLRIPLLTLLSYKGMQFLCEGLNQQSSQSMPAQCNVYPQISNELNLLQKQLKEYQISKQDILVKKITKDYQDLYIIYFKDTAKYHCEELKSQNFTDIQFYKQIHFRPNILEQLKFTSQTSSHYIQQLINNYRLAYYINLIYQGCQGQLQQESFFDMIIQSKSQIWSIIKDVGYEGQCKISKALVLKIVQQMSSIKFNYHKQMLKHPKKIIEQINVRYYNYDFKSMQVKQITQNFNKYLSQEKIQLALEAYKLQQQINIPKSQLKINQAKIKSQQKQYDQAIRILQQLIDQIPKSSYNLIQIYGLLISTHILANNEQHILNTFLQMQQVITFYFGQSSFIHSMMYSVLGSYYSQNKQKHQQAETFYEISLKIAINIYGNKSVHVADVYLNKAHHLLNLDRLQQCEHNINQALQICKHSSKNSFRIAQAMFLNGRLHIAKNKLQDAINFFNQTIKLYLKINYYVKAINVCFYLLEMDYVKYNEEFYQKILEQCCIICLKHKNRQFFKRVLKIILKTQINHFPSQIKPQILLQLYDPENEAIFEQTLLQLQQFYPNYGSFMQMIKWGLNVLCFKGQNSESERATNIIANILHILGSEEQIKDVFQ